MTIHNKNVKMFKIHGCLANARAYRLHPVAAGSTPYTWLQMIKTIKRLGNVYNFNYKLKKYASDHE